MDFLELAKKRYTVRTFSDRTVEEEKLNKILEAGNIAPTAKNNQPQKIYVVKSKEGLEKVRSLTKCHYNAPVVLIIGYDKQQEWQNPLENGVYSGIEDVSIVATHMMLEATNLGLSTCWVNYFSPSEVKEKMNLSDTEKVVLFLLLGYEKEGTKPFPDHTKKKNIEETVKFL